MGPIRRKHARQKVRIAVRTTRPAQVVARQTAPWQCCTTAFIVAWAPDSCPAALVGNTTVGNSKQL